MRARPFPHLPHLPLISHLRQFPCVPSPPISVPAGGATSKIFGSWDELALVAGGTCRRIEWEALGQLVRRTRLG